MSEPLQALIRRVVGRVTAERGRTSHPAGTPVSARAAGIHVAVDGGACGTVPRPSSRLDSGPENGGATLIDAEALATVPDGASLGVPRGAVVTPLAREEAARRSIRLEAADPGTNAAGRNGPMLIALGCDHGGYATKQLALGWLRELGHRPLDLGTYDENAVDYPDFALEVGRAVSEGRAALGIVIDGAGIGSAIAANKVPGVRAATCWDAQSASNAREHNYANVLSIGGRMLAESTCREVVRTFLSTPEGAARHGRRVQKIQDIERRYLRFPERVEP